MPISPLLRNKTRRFLKDEDGASAIEYAVIAGLIAVAMIATAKDVGTQIDNVFQTVKTELSNVNGSGGGSETPAE